MGQNRARTPEFRSEFYIFGPLDLYPGFRDPHLALETHILKHLGNTGSGLKDLNHGLRDPNYGRGDQESGFRDPDPSLLPPQLK